MGSDKKLIIFSSVTGKNIKSRVSYVNEVKNGNFVNKLKLRIKEKIQNLIKQFFVMFS
jgi:hypothetical protein